MQNSRHNRLLWIILSFFFIVLFIKAYFWLPKKVRLARIVHEVKSNFESEVKPLLPQAVQNLRADSNDWLVCTDLGLSLNNIDDPAVRAAFVAYYRYGQQYCSSWWEWQGSPCKQMKLQLSQASDPTLLQKKITLCELAQKIH